MTYYPIRFSAIGLDFVGTCRYTPGRPEVRYLSNGDPGYPAEPAEIEFDELTVDGRDATFLIDCAVWPQIEFAAIEECEQMRYEARMEAEADRRERQHEEY
jgi:hypothetical protein